MPSKKQSLFLIINKETIASLEREKAKIALVTKSKIKQAQTQVIKDETSHSNLAVSHELTPLYDNKDQSISNQVTYLGFQTM